MVLETYMRFCLKELYFLIEKVFTPNHEENRPKVGFLKLLRNLVINFSSIWSIMKVYINCYIPLQILYLGKIT